MVTRFKPWCNQGKNTLTKINQNMNKTGAFSTVSCKNTNIIIDTNWSCPLSINNYHWTSLINPLNPNKNNPFYNAKEQNNLKESKIKKKGKGILKVAGFNSKTSGWFDSPRPDPLCLLLVFLKQTVELTISILKQPACCQQSSSETNQLWFQTGFMTSAFRC